MKKYISLSLGTIAILTAAFLGSCNKINLATELGQDLIPAVDNIHTFDTTLEVETYNNIFSFAQDSFRSIGSDEQFLGIIDNDPIFGKTDARMFFQLLPTTFKTTFLNAPGKLYLDSVVLVLDYAGTYGDSTTSQTIEVAELSPSTNFKFSGSDRDSAYSVRENNFVTTNILATKTIIPAGLNDSIKVYSDTTSKQLRIRLDQAFGTRLLNYDTTGANDAYSSDSAFKTKFQGFALRSTSSGRGIMGFNLLGNNTKLAIYYRYDNKTTAGDIDTAVTYFKAQSTKAATANFIGRDYSGTQIMATANDAVADPFAFIQNAPGTFATIKIPGLEGLNNRVVHLAELQMESVYDPQDTIFNAPPLFLDILDKTTNKYKTVPYAFEGQYQFADYSGTTYNISNIGLSLFGSFAYNKKDPSGNPVKLWKFNVTRYVQNLVKGAQTAGDFRLYTIPYLEINDGTPNSTRKVIVQSVSAPVKGRVRLGGGSHPTQKMKLHIVYSKI